MAERARNSGPFTQQSLASDSRRAGDEAGQSAVGIDEAGERRGGATAGPQVAADTSFVADTLSRQCAEPQKPTTASTQCMSCLLF